MKIFINRNKKAFSLIEVLVVVFIASVVFTSFYTVSTVGTRYIIESKNRLGAVAFANEKMEIVRNLPYDKVGVQGSAEVDGNIPQEQDVNANGRWYKVLTSVRYFDDPMDGTTTSSPADAIPNDYKIVDIKVSWVDSNGQTQSVSSSSRFVPPGLETSVNGSPLSLNISDGDTLLPVGQAIVHIFNNTTIPVINDTMQTDNNGNVMLPAARISDGSKLSITKIGYEFLETMDASPTFTPTYGNVNVVAGFLNTYNYFINKLASLTIRSADYQNNPVGGVEFSVGGGKVIGKDLANNDVFSMANTTGITDAVSGEKEYLNISSGNYSVGMSVNAQFEFIDFDPSVSPVFVASAINTPYIIRVADKNTNALFLEVKEVDAPNAPIAGAKVTLTDGATEIFTQKLSSLRGVVFYPDVAQTLENKDYTLKVEADGYITDSRSITIDKLTPVRVDLAKI